MRRLVSFLAGAALAFAAAPACAQAVKPVSAWSGVYTVAQNKRGEEVHAASCVMCHGPRLNGAGQPEMPPSPAIAGPALLRKFAGANVAALFVYVSKTMPPDAPGTLTEQQAIDAIAHMFAVTGMPPGGSELLPDMKALGNILIEAQPKP